MTNRYLLCTERLKKLEPIMEGLLVKEDAYKRSRCNAIVTGEEGRLIYYGTPSDLSKTYSYASLESVLPDFCFDYSGEELHKYVKENLQLSESTLCNFINGSYLIQLIDGMKNNRGQEKLEHMADLIILLHDNGVELRRNDD